MAGMERRCSARHGGPGQAWLGLVWHGEVGPAGQGVAGLGAAWLAWLGAARLGWAWLAEQGASRFGQAPQAWKGNAWRGRARRGRQGARAMGKQFPINVRRAANGDYILEVGCGCLFIAPGSLNEVVAKLSQVQFPVARPPKKV